MSKKKWSKILSLLARTALAFTFVFGQTARAGQGQNPKDKPSSNGAAKPKQTPANGSTAAGAKAQFGEEETASEESSSKREESQSQSGGQLEGIKVHGHWTIEVRNPDGSLATHREFENSFELAGTFVLAPILGGAVTTGPWEILLYGPCTGPGGSNLFDPGGSGCIIVPNTLAPFAPPGTSFFPNLTVSSSHGQVVLTGSAVATQNIGVSEVFTGLSSCANSTTPLSCAQASPAGFQQFTAAILSPAQIVQVTAGQTIAVTVNITFSA